MVEWKIFNCSISMFRTILCWQTEKKQKRNGHNNNMPVSHFFRSFFLQFVWFLNKEKQIHAFELYKMFCSVENTTLSIISVAFKSFFFVAFLSISSCNWFVYVSTFDIRYSIHKTIINRSLSVRFHCFYWLLLKE